MFAIHRTRLGVIALSALVTLAALGVTQSAPAGASTQTTVPQPAAATAAAAWLGDQFTSGGFIPLPDSINPDYSSTANAVLALAAAGVDANVVESALPYLEANSAGYITIAGSDGPGQLALLIMVAHAVGVDPTDFGGTNLVSRLLATEQTTGPNTGLFGTDAQVVDFAAGPYDQGLAFAALKAAGVTADAASVAYLKGQQCPDGGWPTPDIANNSCTVDPNNFSAPGPDTNATALAIEGLNAQDASTNGIILSALGFFQDGIDPDGGWGYSPNTVDVPGTTDPDSTALVIQALLSIGLPPYAVSGNSSSPVDNLLGFVVPGGTDAGAISSPFGSPSVGNLLATYQTVPALAGQPFPINPPSAPTVTALSAVTGSISGGTAVSISGANLANPSAVSFGSTPAASFSVNSPTSITAIAPPGATAGSVDVTVTTFGGTSATSAADQFTYEPTSGPYTPLTPVRICDTRDGNPSALTGSATQCDGSPVAAGGIKTISVAGSFGVPANALSVNLNVTVVNPAGAGFLTAFPSGATLPTASNINYIGGQIVPNLISLSVGSDGSVSFYSSAATDLVVDVEGYSASTSPNGNGSGLFTALTTPSRLCDTRATSASEPNNQCGTGPLARLSAGGTISVNVAGTAGVPTGALAAVLNVTAVNPSASGILTAYQQDGSLPNASNVNYVRGQIVANRVVVPLSTTGSMLGAVTIYSSQAVDVVVDVSGYYSAASGTGSNFNAEAAPVRICDTRSASAPNQCSAQTLQAGGTLTINVAGLAGVPARARAVAINVTGISPSQATFLSVYPGPRVPSSSDLNLSAGEVRANLAVVGLSSNGTVTIANHSGTIDVVVDVAGWYVPPTP